MSEGKDGSRIWTAPAVRGSTLPDAEKINRCILTAFADLTDDDFSRRTHFVGGRFENLYLDCDKIPELQIVLDRAEACARQILGWGTKPMRRGFWLNAQGPGQSTSEHTHDELDELLSGVYYLEVPEGSGDIILQEGRLSMRVRPQAGMFLFFPPSLNHWVETNRSGEMRLSLAFNFGPMERNETG